MPNRLANETSPYLKQHADNPVDWYPWGEEALARARRENKPILLSVGYSACHWCHVMAHESFEDPDIAALMNRHFVNIKVDREERPDLDQIYQAAHAMLTQRSGGWPLTMFLTPDQVPFFGGTYFPKTARYNLPGFAGLLERVAQFYREHPDEIAKQNASLLDALRHGEGGAAGALNAAPLEFARRQLGDSFDPVHGGFGGAPKFPHPSDLSFLLRYAAEHDDAEARRMACLSLRKMADGGLYDQLGGGFYRYSVDAEWLIPHFEKMLYDNGLLLSVYSDAYRACADARFERVITETVDWALREMRAPAGGFYAALDADAEGGEGAFYVWQPHMAQARLSDDEYRVLARHYGLDQAPNFEHSHWHLHVAQPLEAVAAALGLDPARAAGLLDSARAKLFAARAERPAPGIDNKILTSWNALMIQGLARASVALERPDWIAVAQETVDFVRGNLWQGGRLLAACTDGQAHLNAYLDDYAFLLDALLDLLQADYRAGDLAFAQELAEVLLAEFEDTAAGGFFFTGHGHEKLISRPKPAHDSAMPAGNGVAAFALQRLGHLLGETRYLRAAERTLQAFHATLARYPAAAMSLLLALDEYLHPPRIILLRGERDALPAWRDALRRHWAPADYVLALPNDLTGLPPALDKPKGSPVGAWVCQDMVCSPEIREVGQVLGG
ncbi:MAG: thioredoxin domain-containing protein [Pseudomonadota bacterium]